MSKYDDLNVIGTGGFAEVWLCERHSDKSRFAKKVLISTASDKIKQRFKEEVRILAKLDHPRIVKVVETQLSAEPLWFVMPLYARTLKDELTGVIGDEQRITKVFSQILDAVEYAHREGVIHRDLKPHNVLMNSDDDIAVSDFGIGRVLDAAGDRVTRTGAAMGTRYYISPEQSTDAKHVDVRTDVFSLGRMLYELYTERLNTAVQQLDRVPTTVAPIIDRCTRYSPDERYSTVAELKSEWRALIRAAESPGNEEEVSRLVAEVIATPDNAPKILSLLSNVVHEGQDLDLLADVLIKIPHQAIAIAFQRDAGLVATSIEQFTEYLLSQKWGVSYVDKAGMRCANYFTTVSDPNLRMRLLACALTLGIKHRRPSVIEASSHMLQSLSAATDIAELRSIVSSLEKDVVQEIPNAIALDECDRQVSSLFT